MSASAWENCPFCYSEEAVREDYEIYLNENGSVLVYFKAVCRRCGAKWEMRKDINCLIEKGNKKWETYRKKE